LIKCLDSIADEISRNGSNSFLIVVENDDRLMNAAIVDELKTKFPSVQISYQLETEIGIAAARNRAITMGLASDANWIAFIDDDEEVEPGWLGAMQRAAFEFDAEALTGPVLYSYETLPAWLPSLSLKNRERGSRLLTAATNNAAVKTAWLRSRFPTLSFDREFDFTGGEDSDFFYRLTDVGGRIKWVDDAYVSEVVPAPRLEMKYQLARTARVAENAFRIHRRRRGIAAASLRYAPKAIGRFGRGLLLIAAGLALGILARTLGARVFFHGCKALASTLGTALGILHLKLNPYRS